MFLRLGLYCSKHLVVLLFSEFAFFFPWLSGLFLFSFDFFPVVLGLAVRVELEVEQLKERRVMQAKSGENSCRNRKGSWGYSEVGRKEQGSGDVELRWFEGQWRSIPCLQALFFYF